MTLPPLLRRDRLACGQQHLTPDRNHPAKQPPGRAAITWAGWGQAGRDPLHPTPATLQPSSESRAAVPRMLIMARNSRRVAASSRKAPSMREVTIDTPGL